MSLFKEFVDFQRTAQRCLPEDRIHKHRCEDLRSYLSVFVWLFLFFLSFVPQTIFPFLHVWGWTILESVFYSRHAQRFFFLHLVHTVYGVHPVLYTTVTAAPFSRAKMDMTWNWPLTFTYYDFENSWSSTSIPPIFLQWKRRRTYLCLTH